MESVGVPFTRKIDEFNGPDQQVEDAETRNGASEIVIKHDLSQRRMLDKQPVYFPNPQPWINQQKDADLEAEKYIEDVQQPVH